MIEQKGILRFMESVHFWHILMVSTGSYGIDVGEDYFAWLTMFNDDPWIDTCMNIDIL